MDTRPQPPSGTAGVGNADDRAGATGDSLVELVRQLAHQGSHLAEQQLKLIKAEVGESLGEVKTAVGSMVGAAVVGIAGLGVVLMGLAYLVGDMIGNLGVATLAVGIITLVIAWMLYAAGRKKVEAASLAPDRSIDTIERTPKAVRGELKKD